MRGLFLLSFAVATLSECVSSLSDAVSSKSTVAIGRHRSPPGDARRQRRQAQSQSQYGAIGLGDDADLTYTVSLQIGGEAIELNLDTGSSDLWTITTACNSSTCAKATPYSPSSFKPVANNATLKLVYGDSTSGTYASGLIGADNVQLAGLDMASQVFLAVNDTNNVSVENGAAGVFGLGFPSASNVQARAISVTESDNTDNMLNSIPTIGPLLPRMAATGTIGLPMFTITLQRDTIDSSASTRGQLTIGTLPDNIDNSSLTWVPVRLYSTGDGGIQSPSFATNEIYPLRWEIPLDGVFIDGTKVPNSNITSPSPQVTALIDTGNSILRGPQDVVQAIYTAVSPTFNASATNTIAPYDCNTPHTLSFQFGGKQFPVDPRDFLSPSIVSTTGAECDAAANVVKTDPPSLGSLFSWSLGDTFLKSNLVAFYYGNLTHPSVDPPRIGLLSLVPDSASEVVQEDVQTALAAGAFFGTSEPAPTSTISLTSRSWLYPATELPSPFVNPGSNTSSRTSGSVKLVFDAGSFALLSFVLSISLSILWIS